MLLMDSTLYGDGKMKCVACKNPLPEFVDCIVCDNCGCLIQTSLTKCENCCNEWFEYTDDDGSYYHCNECGMTKIIDKTVRKH